MRLALCALVVSLAATGGGTAMAAGKTMSLEELRATRKKAAHRKRRIIFNNDGNEPVYFLDEATKEAFLACRTAPLEGSHVDSIFYCTWSSGFSFFTHDTKAGQVFDTTANPKHKANTLGGFSKNKTRAFIEQGTDPLKMMVEWCKAHGVEIFWSFRMNDTHDGQNAWYSDPLFPQLKRDHPEWLVSSKARRTPHGAWSAVDYGRQEIRDLAVAFIEEVCRNYGVDGIEMDFFRHPLLFKTPAWGKDATADELAKLTAMARRVRQVTEREGLKRGRSILVGVRVPDSAAYCKAMGIDIEAWLTEGLIDVMAVSGYFRLNPWATSVALGHKHGVPVYPCLSETRQRDGEARKVRASVACYRARAANAWASGADGVYLFNSFNPRSPLWRELGDPTRLAAMDKVYTTGARDPAAVNRWMAKGETRFLRRQILCPARPLKLLPGKPTSVEIPIGQTIAKGANVVAQLRVKGLPGPADLSVALNGKPLVGGKNGIWIDYAVAPALVKAGINRFELTLKPASAAKPVLQDLLLRMGHKKGT